jgi:hypothetical protein
MQKALLATWFVATGSLACLASELSFGVDGKPLALVLSASNRVNRIHSAAPGRGFFVRTFTGSEVEDTLLSNVTLDGGQLRVAADSGFPRLTFDLRRRERYVALTLKRVEGLPARSLAALHFEAQLSASDSKILALDYMTKAETRDNTLVAQFPFLWHRHADDPLGGFVIYAAGSDAESDEALLDIWCNEDLPKPKLAEPWTPARARRWLADYHEKFKDMTTMIVSAGSEAELYQLTDVAASKGVKIIYLHTDTWRGEYWPREYSHVHVNTRVFPAGRADLKRYKLYLAKRGMNLALHTTSGGIGPCDPKRIAGHVDRNLATWCRGRLVEAVDKDSKSLVFQPEPGSDIPLFSSTVNGPGLRWSFFDVAFMRMGEEIVRVGVFEDSDKPVWKLFDCQRGYGATEAGGHPAGEEMAGLYSAYGQNFVPENDSPLLEEMAREYAQFANEIGLDQLEYDCYEIHGLNPWGPRKYSDKVARHLDHPVISNTSSGVPVASNIELLFSRIKRINQFGYHTVNLSFQLDGHRPATSIMDADFEMSSLIAKGVRHFQVLKPEPMFGLSLEILATHGLVDEMFSAFNLWRAALPLMSEGQLKAMRDTLTPFGNHMKGKDLFQVRKAGDRYEVIPTRVMVRKEGDVPWLVGQEFGPVGPRQFCRPGQTFDLENPFEAQPAGFVIRVLAELGEGSSGKTVAAGIRAGDVMVDSYRTGADAAGKSVDNRTNALQVVHTANVIQPKAGDIKNQRLAQFAQDGDTLVMTAENPRGEPVRVEEDLPSWRKEFSMPTGRGIAMEIDGDGSGAVLLLQLSGRGVRDYVVKVDFKGTRTVVIPNGEASWADGNWGWRFGTKHFDYTKIYEVSLGFGYIPPKTNPRVRISNVRVLADVPSKLVNPVITTGAGKLTVNGEVETGCYLRYEGGDVASVHDRNWKKLRELKVVRENYVMPTGFAPVRVTVAAGASRPMPLTFHIINSNIFACD